MAGDATHATRAGGNLEVVRRCLERHPTLRQDDPGEVRRFVEEFWDPHGDYYPAAKWRLDLPECHGHEQITRFHLDYLAAWDEVSFEFERGIPVGDDRVLACSRLTTEGRDSGVRLGGEIYQCFWLRHRRFVRLEDHLTIPGALHALGLDGETLAEAGLEADAEGDRVETLTLVFAAFTRRDVEGWLDGFCADAELLDRLSLNPNAYRGRDELVAWFRGWDKVWDEIEISEPVALREDGDVMVVRWTARGRGHGSGVAVAQDFYGAVRFHGSKAAVFECHSSEADAIEAASELA